MAKRNRNVIAELADVLAEGADPSGDYFEKVIDATAGHDRPLRSIRSAPRHFGTRRPN